MIKVKATSWDRLEKEAMYYRNRFGFLDYKLDIISLYDALQEEESCYEVMEDDDPIFPPNVRAFYSVDSDIIYIKSSIYDQACDDVPTERFTLAHELGHYILHGKNYISYSNKCNNKPYEDPEAQANYFAGCVLAPWQMIIDSNCKTVEDIQKLFCVSKQCATYRFEKILKIKKAN